MSEMSKTRTCTSNENTHSSSWPNKAPEANRSHTIPVEFMRTVISDAADVCHNTGQVVSKSRSRKHAF